MIKIYHIFKKIIYAFKNRLLILWSPYKYAQSIGVKLGKDVYFYGATPGMFGSEPWLITLGTNVHIVSGSKFITHDGGVLILRKDYPNLELTKPITVGNNVYFGMNSLILPGVKVGNNVIVAAGSIVSKDVENDSVVGGIPARKIKSTDDYLKKALNESLNIGHLSGKEKEKKLKQIFNV